MRRTHPRSSRLARIAVAVACAVTPLLAAHPAAASSPGDWRVADFLLRSPVTWYVDPGSPAARQADLDAAHGDPTGAARMRALAAVPTAVWFTGGTPDEVRRQVGATMAEAARQRGVPVLVAYNIPGRDCGQYHAGGAADEASYRAWIDAFAEAIGAQPAVVVVEPDSLAMLPSEPWCDTGGGGSTGQPEDTARTDERFREIRYAVDRFRQDRLTAVYLDAGHSAWQPLNDYDSGYGQPRQQLGMASRLLRAGIDRATGFFLNVANFRRTDELVDYGTRLSKCLYYREYSGATGCSDADLAGVDVDPLFMTHFVVDTSRNGQGPWQPPQDAYPDPQSWCNPPGRGLGARPTTQTGHPLVDAYLWIKRPGVSDGPCSRGTDGPGDPENNGTVDPDPQTFWPEYADGLIDRADPPLPVS
ncbi:MAG TPA: glycoside hydrolase family 6 protein [Micromonosporaceae bacterium]